jgi:hypothetical protein
MLNLVLSAFLVASVVVFAFAYLAIPRSTV